MISVRSFPQYDPRFLGNHIAMDSNLGKRLKILVVADGITLWYSSSLQAGSFQRLQSTITHRSKIEAS